jgi:hypothetical protein
MVTNVHHVPSSGDTTGATDRAALNAVLVTNRCIKLDATAYYIDQPLRFTGIAPNQPSRIRIEGSGQGTTILLAAGVEPCTLIDMKSASLIEIENLTLFGGLHGLHLHTSAASITCTNVRSMHNSGHGVYVSNGAWILNFTNCHFTGNGGDGINSNGNHTKQNGNALSLASCNSSGNNGHGVSWSAAGLCVTGCTIENNGASGICLDGTTQYAWGATIAGSYLENNGIANVELVGAAGGHTVNGVDIAGNYMTQASVPCILAHGPAGTVLGVAVHVSNRMVVRDGISPIIRADSSLQHSTIWQLEPAGRYSFGSPHTNYIYPVK